MTVLAVVGEVTRAAPVAHWAARLAGRLETELVVAWPQEAKLPQEPVVLAASDEPAAESASEELDPAVRALALELKARVAGEVRFVSYSDHQSALEIGSDAEHRYVVAEVPRQRQRSGPSLARQLFDRCPNNVVLLRLGSGEGECSHLLTPLLRGYDNAAALRLAEILAGEEGQITALAVEPPAFTEGEGVGKRWIARSLERAGISESGRVQPRVELAERPEEVLVELAPSFDTVLFGASGLGTQAPNLRTPRSQLLGVIPERLTLGGDQTIGVVREQWTLAARLQLRLGRWLDVSVPQLEREQRIALTERLQAGSEPNFDFFALMGLSTTIAAFGLVQDSAAVVIGAMLVAPLMMPILGAGLSIVQGNLPLLRSSGKALVYGYSLALAISLVIGRLAALDELTPQLLSRGSPNVLDLGVALFSGIAAAYCLARPDLSAALPGVAIAAALVPPIATTGIALAAGELEVAAGSLLLFCTNVAAIIVGAFFSLYAGGLRGQPGSGTVSPWVRSAVIGVLVAVALLVWPLARSTVRRGAVELTEEAAAEAITRSVVEDWLVAEQALLSVHVGAPPVATSGAAEPEPASEEKGTVDAAAVVEVAIAGPSAPATTELDELASRLSERLGKPVELRLTTSLLARVRAAQSGSD